MQKSRKRIAGEPNLHPRSLDRKIRNLVDANIALILTDRSEPLPPLEIAFLMTMLYLFLHVSVSKSLLIVLGTLPISSLRWVSTAPSLGEGRCHPAFAKEKKKCVLGSDFAGLNFPFPRRRESSFPGRRGPAGHPCSPRESVSNLLNSVSQLTAHPASARHLPRCRGPSR